MFREVQVAYNKFFIDERYTNLRPIGDGAYGVVASAYDTVTRQKVAIKKIRDTFSDVVDAKRILREMKLLRHFSSHENIVSLVDIMTVPPFQRDFVDVYIVTNLMESDMERIISSKQPLSDQHHQYFLYQILRVLKYIHSANVLHRDLKPSNLLVNANCDLAVCDFGLARGFDIYSSDLMTEYVVTRWYRAPELLCECTHYGKAVDVWGVGCIFAELINHRPFFKGENPQHQLQVILTKIPVPSEDKLHFVDSHPTLQKDVIAIYQRIQRKFDPAVSAPRPSFESYFPPTAPPLAIDLLKRMLQFHPDDRISVEAALAHPYLKDFHNQLPEPTCPTLFDFDFEKPPVKSIDDSPIGQKAREGFDFEKVEQKMMDRMDGMDLSEWTMPKEDVKALMFEEMLIYRPLPAEVTIENLTRHNQTFNGGESTRSSLTSYYSTGERRASRDMNDDRMQVQEESAQERAGTRSSGSGWGVGSIVRRMSGSKDEVSSVFSTPREHMNSNYPWKR